MNKKEDIYNVIGKNIKKYREKRCNKAKYMVKYLLLSDSFIGKLESVTHQTISIDTLEQMAIVLNVDIKDFFDRD